MPSSPQRPCKHPGCSGFTLPASRWCAQHQRKAAVEMATKRAVLDAQRGTAHERGYDAKWAALSRQMRSRFPISPGYFTRTAFWTVAGAMEFSLLRTAAAGAGRFLELMHAVASVWSGQDARPLTFQGSTIAPIFQFHGSSLPEPAGVTDHIIPHHGDQTLFWSEWNLQTLSKRQHDTKTATEDGGFRGAKPAPHALLGQSSTGIGIA